MGKRADHEECPVHRLKKAELVWLATHHCKHGHTFLEHWGCYRPGTKHKERIGFLDIEASNLSADFGIILSYCIKDSQSSTIYHGVLRENDIKTCRPGAEDKRVVEALVQDIKQFDRIVSYYGTKFDLPFIRTRALACGVPFPPFGSVLHTDLYYLIKHRFKLSSNRLENACRTILRKTQKTRIESRYWRAGARGDRRSLRYILDHNKKDVLDLEKLYWKVIRFAKVQNTSM